jgi:cytochrome c-type biogenesis protein CcmH/NrfF
MSDYLEAAWGLYRWVAVGLFTLWWMRALAMLVADGMAQRSLRKRQREYMKQMREEVQRRGGQWL